MCICVHIFMYIHYSLVYAILSATPERCINICKYMYVHIHIHICAYMYIYMYIQCSLAYAILPATPERRLAHVCHDMCICNVTYSCVM